MLIQVSSERLLLTVLVSHHPHPCVRCSWHRIDYVLQVRKVHFLLGCCLNRGGRVFSAHSFGCVDDENLSRYEVAIYRWNRRETPVTMDASARGRLSGMCHKKESSKLHHFFVSYECSFCSRSNRVVLWVKVKFNAIS